MAMAYGSLQTAPALVLASSWFSQPPAHVEKSARRSVSVCPRWGSTATAKSTAACSQRAARAGGRIEISRLRS